MRNSIFYSSVFIFNLLKSSPLFILIFLLSSYLINAENSNLPSYATINDYCPAQSAFPFEEWIEDVTVGTLENLGSGKFRDYNTAGYSDYTDLESSAIDRNQPVNFNLVAGFSGASTLNVWDIFIDYDQDGQFSFPDEYVANSSSSSGSFVIPDFALSGATRMRIILSNSVVTGPCSNPPRGEVEDYTILIGGTTPLQFTDLTIDVTNYTASTQSGGNVQSQITIDNLGNVRTGDYSIGIYLSTDPVLDNNDALQGEFFQGNKSPNNPLSFGAGITIDLVTPGSYYLIYKVDARDQEDESDETNNIVVRSFTVAEMFGSDLTIRSLSGQWSTVNAGFQARGEVTNVGNEMTGEYYIGIYLSPTPYLSTGSVLLQEVQKDPLAPYTSDIYNVGVTFDQVDVGEYYLIHVVDIYDEESESNEMNNSDFRRMEILPAYILDGVADLELTMTSSEPNPEIYTTTRVTITITNNGPDDATLIRGRLDLRESPDYVVAGNGNINSDGIEDFYYIDGSFNVPFLENGASVSLSVDLFTLSEDSGICAEILSAAQNDPDSTPNNGNCPIAVEDDEASLYQIINNSFPDLILENLSVNPIGIVDGELNFSIDLTNQGLEDAPPFEVKLLIAQDDEPTITGEVLGVFYVEGLAAGTTRIFEANGISLDGSLAGEYFLKLKIDPLEQVEESNENNNFLITDYSIVEEIEGVDIAVNLTVSESNPDVFSNIVYVVTAENLGQETATNVILNFDYGAQESPKRLAFVDATDSDYSDWTGQWNIGTLEPGMVKTFSVEVFTLSAAAPTTIRTARLVSVDQLDTNAENNEKSVTISLDQASTNETISTSEPIEQILQRQNLSLLTAFPNPVQNQVTLVLENNKDPLETTIQLFNNLGKRVHTQMMILEQGSNFIKINTSNLQEGLYIILLSEGSRKIKVGRFFKLK